MTNVTVSETVYNVTVAETSQSVSVGATTGAINVSVNATDLATSIAHSGSQGVDVLKSLENNILTARKIKTTGNDISISQNTDDIDIVLSDTITVDVNGNLAGATTIAGHLTPTTDDTFDLGSTTKRFRDLYLGPGSLYINNIKVLEDDSGTIKFSTDGSQNINIESGGDLTINNTGDTTAIVDGTINLGQSGDSTGTVNVTGTLKVPTKIEVGDTDITPGLLHHDATDGNLEIRTNGAGYLHANVADFYVGPLTGAVKIDENSIGVTAGTLTVTGNLVGNVTGQVSDLSNKSTSDLSEGSNKYYTDERVDDRVNALLQAGSNITLTYDDASNTLTISSTDTEDDLSNNDTDDLAEGSTNLYFTTARARASISASGSLAYNSSTGALTYTQGNTDTVAEGSSNLYYTDARFDTRLSAKSTSDLSEGTNKYYTDERVDDRVNALLVAGSNITLTYDDTANTLTIAGVEDNLSNNDTDDLSEGSSNLYFTNARAISAVEGESTLDLTGALTVDGQISTDSVIKVNDGFILTSFNPYGAGNNMPVTLAGVGQEKGWSAMNIRSRGEHDFGLGAPYNLAPRGFVNLQSGRLDGSDNDIGLSNGDSFGAVLWSPYSSYRTGVEWITPSASIYGIATQDHSESNGFGTKLEFSTTENNSKAGSADLAHTNKTIVFQGTTITTTDTLKIDDDLQVTGDIGNNGSAVDFDDNIKVTGNVSSKTTTIGDFDSSGSPAYSMSGMQIDAGDVAWPTVVFKEYAGTDGGGNKPVNLFTNPGFETEVFGGTPSSPAALGASKRILAINGNAANGATLPGTANLRILGQTVNVQSGTNRGSEFIVQTTPVDTTSTIESLKVIANKIILGQSDFDSGHGRIQANGGDLKLEDRLDTNGNNILNSSGDVTVDDNLKVNTNLTVDGNTTLGNDTSADTVTVNAKLTANGGLVLTNMDTATANYLAGLGAIDEGGIAYINDGDSGSKCIAVYDGSNWKRISLGANISSS